MDVVLSFKLQQEEEQDGGSEEYDAKLDSLVSEVGALKAEVRMYIYKNTISFTCTCRTKVQNTC